MVRSSLWAEAGGASVVVHTSIGALSVSPMLIEIVLRFRQRLSKSDQSFEGLDRSRCRRPETRQGGPDLGGGRWGQDGASRPEPVKKIILN